MLIHEEALRRVPLFSSLPDSQLRKLASELLPAEIEQGNLMFREGDKGNECYIVVEGQVEIIKSLGTRDERLSALRGPGETIGEMSLFIEDHQRTASVRAKTPVKALVMKRDDLENLLRRQPDLAFDFVAMLSRRLEESENHTIIDLREKNRQLRQAFDELKAAQAQIVEKERLEHEMRLARDIQLALLPHAVPVLPGWQVAKHYQPARAVGGDFYDFLSLPDGRLGLVIGDVSDKGVAAALVMATTCSILRAISQQLVSPGQVLEQVNDLLYHDIQGKKFVTCLYAILDPASGRLEYANAGHNLPYRRMERDVAELRATGMPLGLMPGMRYEEKETALAPGESVLFSSDGLVEAHNPQSEMFGLPRLEALLAGHPGGAVLIDFLLAELAAFTGADWEQEDDLTLVTLERSRAGTAAASD